MTESQERISPLILNKRLTAIIGGKTTDDIEDGLPDSSVALMQAENLISDAAQREILYKVPRETFKHEQVQDIARELETLFGFAPHLTNTGRQVIIGDILEHLFGAGKVSEVEPNQRIAIPGYVVDLGRSGEGGLFNEAESVELELLAFRSLRKNADIALGWVNPPQFLRPLGYRIKDMPDVLQHWESELIQNYRIAP